MRVLVTRPADQAAEWVALLREAGVDAQALPLIDIAPLADASALTAAWQLLAARRLVVFVSPNAAERFFAARPPLGTWPAPCWAASPGPGTSRTLQRLGVPADRLIEPAADAAQFDSESLWQQLGRHDWVGASVLLVRGEVGRDWLAERLTLAGACVESMAAYRRVAPRPDAIRQDLLDAALARPREHLWFFSSSESVDRLCDWKPPPAWAASHALATHPRIAERARQAGFARVTEARPALSDVIACLQSLSHPQRP